MPGYVYIGESARGRILRYGAGVFTQIGDAYQLQLRTWDQRPAGPIGEAVFRTIVGVLRHTAGYDVQVTPVLDGVRLTPQRFTGGAPSGAKLEDVVEVEAIVFTAGNAIGAIFESVSLPGELELIDLFVTAPSIRSST
jgi:hypothetical protein